MRLDRLGLVEMSSVVGVAGGVTPLLEKATSGRLVVAIDGCALECCSSALRARGISPAMLFRLDELGVPQQGPAALAGADREALLEALIESLAPAIRSYGASRASLRSASSPPPRDGAALPGQSWNGYLRAIAELSEPEGEMIGAVRTSAVATSLGVSRSSAGEMMKRLERRGLVRRGPRKEIVLTDRGQRAARQAIRRQRVAERFLEEFVGYAPADAGTQAGALADSLDDEMADRMARALDAAPASTPEHPSPRGY